MPGLRRLRVGSVLGVAHVAGMIDMVVLPIWVSVLISGYAFSPAQAGGIVTLFLGGVVVASALVAPAFERLPHRLCVVAGFGLAACAFLVMRLLPVGGADFLMFVLLHAVAGFGVGCALSIAHGTIGRTRNPHRMFGIVNIALGAFGIITFAGMPALIAASGPRALFGGLVATMVVALLVCALGFPRVASAGATTRASGPPTRVPKAVWLVVFTIICLAFNQAMVFSFLSQMGSARGFPASAVTGVLIALGFINLVPGGLAALLQGRVSALAVGLGGPIVQAGLALVLSNTVSFLPFALAGAVYVSVVIFTHTFLFGLLARLDTSGRCVAATPAMMMTGSCAGPAVAGLIVSVWGYGGLGWAASVVSLTAVGLLSILRTDLQSRPARLNPVGG